MTEIKGCPTDSLFSFYFGIVYHPYKLDNTQTDKAEHSSHGRLFQLESCDESHRNNKHSRTVDHREAFYADVLMEAVNHRKNKSDACNREPLIYLPHILCFCCLSSSLTLKYARRITAQSGKSISIGMSPQSRIPIE